MLDLTYTKKLSQKSEELEMLLYDEDITPNDLINYMAKAFRSFSDAINYFLSKYTDFSGNLSSIDDRTDYIYSKYSEIGYSINPANIKNWLSGKAPAYTSNSKEKIYALCFALNFDIITTREFFQKVYFDRCFDCHNITEAIYYYCLKNNLPYSHTVELLSQSKDIIQLEENNKESKTVLYTQVIQQKIDSFESDHEFLAYIKENSDSLNFSRTSAKKIFFDLLSSIQGTREDAKLIASNPHVINDFSNDRPIKSLTVLEYYKYNTEDNPLLQIYSDEFMINQILDNRQHEKKIPKSIVLPAALKSSFPSKHVLNDIRLGFEGRKIFKNDALRKTIIMLFFYKYWCEQNLNINPVDYELRYSTFIEEMNDCITTCGFEPLYIGNPYDWIFIFSSKCEFPLDTFRSIYASLVEYEAG